MFVNAHFVPTYIFTYVLIYAYAVCITMDPNFENELVNRKKMDA